ncbi:hypothetical protein PPSIR1_03078 [Plesiocystis pacifica SIR-1]|uniref:DUF4440 domain-containing protein n=1 Tax=Plesiocystis pacifica SIR-1 TaxID=391625 RepID=A6G986_9BACT|nr:nuclear transport factor 2 family protein [Plesiocystis pacifica]EDM77634.1 hypothetical protein PPSIR1_03078 [Plesiocystis pacifica SIR-1]
MRARSTLLASGLLLGLSACVLPPPAARCEVVVNTAEATQTHLMTPDSREYSLLADEVVTTVERMFAAMREHDVPTLEALVADGAVIVRVGRGEAGEVRHQVVPREAFIAGTAGDGPVIDERFTAPPKVRIDGPMATLWGEYDVRVDGEFRHCGVDAVQLARLEGRWRVTALTYTEHRSGCPGQPDPAPQPAAPAAAPGT